MASTENVNGLLALPAELTLQILSYLSPRSLAFTARVCKGLRHHALSDHLWQDHINANTSQKLTSPSPLESFRDIYIAHHPYWFIPRHRLWICDADPSGKLLLARYDGAKGCIEAYAVVAERSPYDPEIWSHDESVAIHKFEPKIQLHLDQPVIKLNVDSPRADQFTEPVTTRPQGSGILSLWSQQAARQPPPRPRLSQEVLMDCATSTSVLGSRSNSPGLKSSLMLACDMAPEDMFSENTPVWPLLSLPAPSRALNESPSNYSSSGQRPSSLSELSQNTFRIKKWVDFHNRQLRPNVSMFSGPDRMSAASGLSFMGASVDRRGEQVHTYGTLLPESYTPTAKKPWRGIYCGDYSGHGCEFLLVEQPDEGTEGPLPEKLAPIRDWLESGERTNHYNSREGMTQRNNALQLLLDRLRTGQLTGDVANLEQLLAQLTEVRADEELTVEHEEDTILEDQPGPSTADTPSVQDSAVEGIDNPDIYSGRLVATKLTGDPNIPRGQITFIAPDISDKGLIRVAQEEIFRGARIVKSAGHVADRGFRNDSYIPSQLILLSHDRIAQYWERFGHISFYQRVDIDALLKQT
ncbi:hypothetical protein MBLNU457_4410t1 [Dothideomycetes sp. NU457]